MNRDRRARMGAYSLWQLRDYLFDKGLGTALVITLSVLLDWLAYQSMQEPPRAGTSPEERARLLREATEFTEPFLRTRFAMLTATLTLVGSLFATNGIVSDDRKHGYYRFLFAKPAGVPGFYAWKFAMHGVGFLLVSLLFIGIYALAFRPFLPVAFVPGMALLFVAVGGVGFLLSALWRWDWLSLIVVYIAAEVAWSRLGDEPGWRWLVHLLPPVHKLGDVHAAIARETALPVHDLAWLTAYGLVCFVLAMLVLRSRALATD